MNIKRLRGWYWRQHACIDLTVFVLLVAAAIYVAFFAGASK
jgi:hypothetical protein